MELVGQGNDPYHYEACIRFLRADQRGHRLSELTAAEEQLLQW